jgi:hypothetical protein
MTKARKQLEENKMKKYQLTFVWPNGDWTWTDVEAKDFHEAMILALLKLPETCRVQRVDLLTK